MMTSTPVPVACRTVRNGRWAHVTTRSYGTTVYRVDAGPGFYVKTTPLTPVTRDDPRLDPAGEAERLRWLAGQGLPVPEVVEVGGDEHQRWLVTVALPGRPAAGHWDPADRPRVIDLVAEAARSIHALPARGCPFERGLKVSLEEARTAARTGAVDLTDVDPHHAGWTAAELLTKLDGAAVPADEDTVVCHGDLCLGNVLIDPASMTLAGVIDPSRLGTSDRWLDLAIILPDIDEDESWGYGPAYAERFLRRYGVTEVDRHKLDYYRLLDEFM